MLSALFSNRTKSVCFQSKCHYLTSSSQFEQHISIQFQFSNNSQNLYYVKVLMLSQNFCNRSLRVKNFWCFQYLMIQFSGIHHFNGVVLSVCCCAGYLASQAASQVLAVRLSGGGQEEDTDCLDLYFPPARDKLFISHNFCPLKLRCATKMVG